jgi:hypothetical protein
MFKGKSTLVVFGDSNVWGAELKDAPVNHYDFKSIVYDPSNIEIWPYHIRYSFSGVLAERNNMKILNLAIPGCSNDTIFKRVNKFIQGNYPVDLDDCYVMIFWSGVERREFYNATDGRYFNYHPSGASGMLMNYKFFNKFHKVYSKNMLSSKHDVIKSFNYVYSVNGLLSYKGIEFIQGYALFNDELASMIEKHKLPNIISNDEGNAIHTIPIRISTAIAGKFITPNEYVCIGRHPTELGHVAVANQYAELLSKIDNN